MTRLILRALNGPGLVLLITLAVALQTSLFDSWPLSYLQPDTVLLAVIWCALKRSFTEGGILTLVLANIAELHSASTQGLMLITYMTVYLGVRGVSRLVVMPGLSSYILVTLASSIAWKLSGLGILHFLGAAGNQWRHTVMYLFPGAVIEGALAIWAYRWLDKYDKVTFKSANVDATITSELSLAEDNF